MRENGPPVVCSIGTSDPWNAAGLGLDIRVLEAFGVRPVSVVAGVSAQGPHGIALLRALDREAIAAQFAALAAARIAAYRAGALLDAPSVLAVASELARTAAPAVYDPVLYASSGGRFIDDAGLAAIRAGLLPAVALVTPNLAEARTLAGDTGASPLEAARGILTLGARAVLVTGIVESDDLVDLFLDASTEQRFVAPRMPFELRGTGCMLAAGIAASLAGGTQMLDAIARARDFVRERIADAQSLGGMRLMRVTGRSSRGS